jgi:hypothetical protein
MSLSVNQRLPCTANASSRSPRSALSVDQWSF